MNDRVLAREQRTERPTTTASEGPGVSDSALISRIAVGDERALGLLYDRWATVSYGLALAIVRTTAGADEVVAGAFAQVWRGAEFFDGACGSVHAWITTIVRTRALDTLRSRHRREGSLKWSSDTNCGCFASTPAGTGADPDPPSNDEQAEARRLAARALAELPASHRRIIELAYYHGMSQSEIARELAQPLGTVKTRMRTAMEKLRKAMLPLAGPETAGN